MAVETGGRPEESGLSVEEHGLNAQSSAPGLEGANGKPAADGPPLLTAKGAGTCLPNRQGSGRKATWPPGWRRRRAA